MRRASCRFRRQPGIEAATMTDRTPAQQRTMNHRDQRFFLARGPWASLLALALSSCGDSGAPSAAPEVDVRLSDRRVSALLMPCTQGYFYDRDLSSLVPVLIEKLERARPDPLKRAKEELGALEEKVFPELANRFHADFSDPMRSAFLENVVDALDFNPSPRAHELLLEALTHPQESVRSKVLDGLQRWPRPEDFGVLLERLPIETREMRRKIVPVLFAGNRAQAEEHFLGLLERGEERDLWTGAAPLLSELSRADQAPRAAALVADADPLLAVYLAAGAARHDVESGMAFLRAELAHEDAQRRLNAFTAARRSGLRTQFDLALVDDPSPDLRATVLSAFSEDPELTPERREALRGGLSDPYDTVRAEALRILCHFGDAEAVQLALAGLDGEAGVLQNALHALRVPMAGDEALARRALERLLERHTLEEHRPLAQRTALFKSIAQLPLAEAAEFLHRTGVAAGSETLESLRAHDWLMIQAANTGLPGRTRLVELLAAETDPLRRIDLIDALASIRDDLARDTLLALSEDPSKHPLERVFAAQGAIKVGPSWEVAPRLKRISYSLQEASEVEARVALQCLLWTWY